MSINNTTIAEDGAIAVTGGTNKTLISRGGDSNSNHFYVNEDAVANLRRTLDITVKDAKVQVSAPGGYTQERQVIVTKVPIILANGNRTVNTYRTEISVDPETSVAQRKTDREMHSQTLFDTDFVSVYEKNDPS